MRLFIAVCFSNEVKSRLLQIQDRIKAQSLRGNFSRSENMHLTLVFIGETPEGRVPVICWAMDRALPHPPFEFTLEFYRTGCFRHSNKELWWIAADKDCPGLDTLIDLRQRIAGELAVGGIAFDDRPFTAHITLGREIKHSSPIVLSGERISVPVKRISLMKSQHINGRLAYTEISGYDLTVTGSGGSLE